MLTGVSMFVCLFGELTDGGSLCEWQMKERKKGRKEKRKNCLVQLMAYRGQVFLYFRCHHRTIDWKMPSEPRIGKANSRMETHEPILAHRQSGDGSEESGESRTSQTQSTKCALPPNIFHANNINFPIFFNYTLKKKKSNFLFSLSIFVLLSCQLLSRSFARWFRVSALVSLNIIGVFGYDYAVIRYKLCIGSLGGRPFHVTPPTELLAHTDDEAEDDDGESTMMTTSHDDEATDELPFHIITKNAIL